MPKTRPAVGATNWGDTLNSHLNTLMPSNGGINFASTPPTLTSGDDGYTFVDTANKEIRRWNGTGWETLMGGNTIGVTRLTADLDLYVSQDGNNTTGKGTQAQPFKTIQYAVDYTKQKVDQGGYYVRINVATSSVAYAGCTIVGMENISIIGSTTNPGAVVIDAVLPIESVIISGGGGVDTGQVWSPGGGSATCFSIWSSHFSITGCTLKNTNSQRKGILLGAANKSNITLSYVIIGPDAGVGGASGFLSIGISLSHFSQLNLGQNITFSGGMSTGVAVSRYCFAFNNGNIAFSNSATFGTFLEVDVSNYIAYSQSYSGSFVGKRYNYLRSSIIEGASRLNALPGSIAGTSEASCVLSS